MAKKTTPIITHTEILSRAIQSIEGDIEERLALCEGLPEDIRAEMFNKATVELRAKLETLKTLYSIETGADFV